MPRGSSRRPRRGQKASSKRKESGGLARHEKIRLMAAILQRIHSRGPCSRYLPECTTLLGVGLYHLICRPVCCGAALWPSRVGGTRADWGHAPGPCLPRFGWPLGSGPRASKREIRRRARRRTRPASRSRERGSPPGVPWPDSAACTMPGVDRYWSNMLLKRLFDQATRRRSAPLAARCLASACNTRLAVDSTPVQSDVCLTAP